jgi:hypothetical protein
VKYVIFLAVRRIVRLKLADVSEEILPPFSPYKCKSRILVIYGLII